MFKRQMKLLFPMVLLLVGLYGARLLWWHYMNGLRAPLGLIGIFVLGIPFLLMIIVVGGVFALVLSISLYRTDTVYPSILALFGALFVLFLPLPEPPILQEVIHFQEHRADYKAVVELVRNGSLEDSSHNYCKYPPPELTHVSEGGCISITDYNDGLKVVTHPIDKKFYSIIYIENDTDITHCGHRFNIEEKLDEHWYLCWRDA